MMIDLSMSVSPGLEVQVGGVDGVGEGDVGVGGALVVGGRVAAGVPAATVATGRGGGRGHSAAGDVAGFLVPGRYVGTWNRWFDRI